MGKVKEVQTLLSEKTDTVVGKEENHQVEISHDLDEVMGQKVTNGDKETEFVTGVRKQ